MPYILIIDDEESISKMIAVALKRVGFEVDMASSGQEGLFKYNASAFDVVITDIKMPGISGNEILRDIKRSKRPHTPVIGMSGTPWELLGGNFDAVLPKPFPIKALIRTVQDFCRN